MRKLPSRIIAVAFGAALLAGCAQGVQPVSPKAQRALIGAGAGAVAAKAFNEDVGKGALAGATVGALCDDMGICQPAY